MSKVVKVIEKVLVGLTMLGLVVKLLHWPGGAMLIILGLGILAMFYPIAAYFLFSPVKYAQLEGFAVNKTSPGRVVLSLGTGLCLPVGVIGLLFKMMHWPGAAVMLLIGLVTIVPIAIVSLVRYAGDKEDFYKQIAIRTVIVAVWQSRSIHLCFCRQIFKAWFNQSPSREFRRR